MQSNLWKLFIVCLYLYWRFNYQRRVGIPLTGLISPHFSACPKPGPGFPIPYCCPFCVLWFEVRGGCHIFVPVPSQDPDFKNHMFNDLRWEVIVCFIYIGGIVDHHCVNFLFAAPSFTPNSVFIIWIQLFLLLIFLFRHGYPVLIIQNNANSDKIENSV
jgi:hypothetical protein